MYMCVVYYKVHILGTRRHFITVSEWTRNEIRKKNNHINVPKDLPTSPTRNIILLRFVNGIMLINFFPEAIQTVSIGWVLYETLKIVQIGNGSTVTMWPYRFGVYPEVTKIAPDTTDPKDGFGRIPIAMLRLISSVNIVRSVFNFAHRIAISLWSCSLIDELACFLRDFHRT